MGTPTKKQQRRYNPVAKQLSKKQYQQQIKNSFFKDRNIFFKANYRG
jgi:hypothetical protein